MPHEIRDQVVDYVRKWSEKTEVTGGQIQKWIGIWSSTYHSWTKNYGRAFEHNGWIPRDHWLDEWEKQAILQYHFDQPLAGYRRDVLLHGHGPGWIQPQNRPLGYS